MQYKDSAKLSGAELSEWGMLLRITGNFRLSFKFANSIILRIAIE